METYELLKELSKKPKGEIEFGLSALMLQNKIDYVSMSNAYVNSLDCINKDKSDELTEAVVCLMDIMLISKKKLTSDGKAAVQRSLYLLNQSKRFNMEDINAKLEYNEDEAKKLSHYMYRYKKYDKQVRRKNFTNCHAILYL